MGLRKMLVYHLPFLPLFCKHVRAPPVDLSPSPELHAPIKRRHRRPSAHRHARLLNVVRHLRRPLQVEMKGLPQRPQPANPLVLRRRKPHEPAVKQFQSTSHIAPVDRPHLLPFQMQYLPTRALSHGSPPNLISGTRPTPILHPPATHGIENRNCERKKRKTPPFDRVEGWTTRILFGALKAGHPPLGHQCGKFAYFTFFDVYNSAKRIYGFVQQTRAGSSQWRNHRSRMTRRENHWLARRIRESELTSRVGR